jgi:predicted small secreted protein
MTEIEKAWVEPKLIVLVRSNPEEAVLATCKTLEGGGNDVNALNSACWFNHPCAQAYATSFLS